MNKKKDKVDKYLTKSSCLSISYKAIKYNSFQNENKMLTNNISDKAEWKIKTENSFKMLST